MTSFRIPRFYQETDGFIFGYCGDSSGLMLASFCCWIKFYGVTSSMVLVVQVLRQQAATTPPAAQLKVQQFRAEKWSLLLPQHPKQDEVSA